NLSDELTYLFPTGDQLRAIFLDALVTAQRARGGNRPGNGHGDFAECFRPVEGVSAPERKAASTTTVPAGIAATRRLRDKKRWRCGVVPGANSLTTVPVCAMR